VRVKAKDEAAINGVVIIEVCVIKDTEEGHRRVHSNVRLAEVLKDGQREEGVGLEVRQHHPVGGQHRTEE
jgi:hypothetical protein